MKSSSSLLSIILFTKVVVFTFLPFLMSIIINTHNNNSNDYILFLSAAAAATATTTTTKITTTKTTTTTTSVDTSSHVSEKERYECHTGIRDINGRKCKGYLKSYYLHLEQIAAEEKLEKFETFQLKSKSTSTSKSKLNIKGSVSNKSVEEEEEEEEVNSSGGFVSHHLTNQMMKIKNSHNQMNKNNNNNNDISYYGKPYIEDDCFHVTWWNSNATNSWGNCVSHGIAEDGYRYMVSNNVPNYFYNPYCPFGLHQGYCIDGEDCPFTDLKCGITTSDGFTEYGDVWVPIHNDWKIPAWGDPTRSDRPGDIYSMVNEESYKSSGPGIGYAINGIQILGPNEAGGINVDVAGIQLTCGGHVTPPVQRGPVYHYHKAPDCLKEFRTHQTPVSQGGLPDKHGDIFGYANDGFKIYTFWDINQTSPVLDECNGHFGPINDDGEVEYHYHVTPHSPYHLGCQGPALGKCETVQHGANFCAKGCNAEVCIQPGTNHKKLIKYLSKFDNNNSNDIGGSGENWLSKYKTNEY